MGGWRRLSIATKLPLAIGTLLLVILGAMTAMVYVEVRHAVQALAEERLERASQQLATMLGTSAQRRFTTLTELGAHPLVDAFLVSPSTAADTLETALANNVARADELVTLEIWDASGQRILAAGEDVPPVDTGLAQPLVRAVADGGQPIVGLFDRAGDDVLYPIVAPITSAAGIRGYVVERRRVGASPESIEQVANLIGSDARLLLGNMDGDVWTDLTGPVARPAIDARADTGVLEYRDSGGDSVLARAQPIMSTPWALVLEFPRDPVFAPARAFLARASFLSLLFVTAGAGLGWVMTRRISLPLRRVSRAAESLAAGGGVEPIVTEREDEVGRLAASFNTMTARVEASRRELEQRVADRTAALQAANDELEAFSYSVSHDLRAPLRAVDGFSAVLIEDHRDELSPDAQRCLGMIRQGAQQMGRLIDDLLTFSRLGRQPMNPVTVDMTDLARSAMAEARSAEDGRSIEVSIRPLPPAHGEPTLLRQVFANYVQNALKFTRDRDPAHVEVGAHEDGDEIVYFVRDNGVGFDMRYVDKLFGVFQRLHPAESFEGTGVGLAIVQRAVQRHGGRVWAEAEVDRGATFYFTLPRNA